MFQSMQILFLLGFRKWGGCSHNVCRGEEKTAENPSRCRASSKVRWHVLEVWVLQSLLFLLFSISEIFCGISNAKNLIFLPTVVTQHVLCNTSPVSIQNMPDQKATYCLAFSFACSFLENQSSKLLPSWYWLSMVPHSN